MGCNSIVAIPIFWAMFWIRKCLERNDNICDWIGSFLNCLENLLTLSISSISVGQRCMLGWELFLNDCAKVDTENVPKIKIVAIEFILLNWLLPI